MDDRGRPLATAGDDDEPGSPAQLEAKARLEDQLVKKVGSDARRRSWAPSTTAST